MPKPEPVDPIVSFFDLCRARQTSDAKRRGRAVRELAQHGIEVTFRDARPLGLSRQKGGGQ